jgi:hypothetical protein
LLIKIFQRTLKACSNSSEVFSYDFNLIFNEKIIQYSKTFAPQVQTSWNQAHAPLLVKSFPKTPKTQSKTSQFGGFYNYKTKLTNFLHK